jgi:hypothetical protein
MQDSQSRRASDVHEAEAQWRQRSCEAVAEVRRLVRPLRSAFPQFDMGAVEDALSSALLDWLRSARRDKTKDARGFLFRAAWRNLLDLGVSERARRDRERDWSAFRLDDTRIRREDESVVGRAITEIRERLSDDRLRIVFDLRARGERRTAVYARALGVEAEDSGMLRRSIKREKDRLDKHLQRDPEVRRIAAEALRGAH